MSEYVRLVELDPDEVPPSRLGVADVKARGRRRTRRRRIVAVAPLVAVVALAAAVVATTGGSGRDATVQPAATATPDPAAAAAARAALVARVPGQQVSDVVAVPGGDEAASWDHPTADQVELAGDAGRFTFWSLPSGGSWTAVGSAGYPSTASPGEPTTVRAVLLHGMAHATYFVSGPFTGDGAADHLVFAAGDRGWGVVSRAGAVLVDAASDDGLERDAYPSDGVLVTVATDPFSTNAEGNVYPLVTRWSWTGSSFARSSDNAFTATEVPAPAAAPTTSGCPTALPDGTYAGYLQGVYPGDGALAPSPDDASGNTVGLSTVQVRFAPAPGADGCTLTAPARLPLVVAARTTAGTATWITAPAWLLAVDFSNDPGIGTADTTAGESNWIVPPSLGIAAVTSSFGSPTGELQSRTTHGQVTVLGGRVTGLALTSAP